MLTPREREILDALKFKKFPTSDHSFGLSLDVAERAFWGRELDAIGKEIGMTGDQSEATRRGTMWWRKAERLQRDGHEEQARSASEMATRHACFSRGQLGCRTCDRKVDNVALVEQQQCTRCRDQGFVEKQNALSVLRQERDALLLAGQVVMDGWSREREELIAERMASAGWTWGHCLGRALALAACAIVAHRKHVLATDVAFLMDEVASDKMSASRGSLSPEVDESTQEGKEEECTQPSTPASASTRENSPGSPAWRATSRPQTARRGDPVR